jgi:hypothetical protein
MRCGIKEKDISDFEKYAKKLDEVMKRILQYNSNAEIYLNMDVLELHGNSSFIDILDDTLTSKYNEESCVSRVWIRRSSGGEL